MTAAKWVAFLAAALATPALIAVVVLTGGVR